MKQYTLINMNFRDKVNIEELNKRIESFTRMNPNLDYVINIPDTIGVSSSFVQKLHPKVKIRIASSYDDDRLESFKDVKYNTGEDCKAAYIDSVIYTRNETIKILREIEEIEKGIQKNWSDLQKTLYIYDKIKTTIMYDPKYNNKASSEIRSLRGLITKQTVCAGYSMILQEILERNGIKCRFIVGNAHAWNVITIDDCMYAADLTSDNYSYRHGEQYTHLNFAQSEVLFGRGRKPVAEERNKDYVGKLRALTPDTVEKIAGSLISEKDYEHTSNLITRNDGSRFYLAQVGKKIVENGKIRSTYRKYYYADVNKDGTYSSPKILYAYIDVFKYMNQVAHGELPPTGYGHAITNVLFSKENIRNSEYHNSGFLGDESKPFSSLPVQKVSDIHKDLGDIRNTQIQTRIFNRSDKTSVIVELIDTDIVNGKTIYNYKVYEMLPGKNKKTVKANEIHTELDLLKTVKANIGNYLLHRGRLDKKSNESGGYIGYLDNEGKIKYNTKIAEHYSKNKRINLPDLYPNRPIILPDFKELEYLARTYEVLYDQAKKETFVRNIKTKERVDNDRLTLKAIFASIWLTSAGYKVHPEDQRNGIKCAFSSESKTIYRRICSKINTGFSFNSYIDTVEIYNELLKEKDIVSASVFVKMFKNQFQAEYIHRLFYNAQAYKRATRYPEVLYNIETANNLVSQKNRYF